MDSNKNVSKTYLEAFFRKKLQLGVNLGQKLFVSSFVDNNVSATAALKVLEALTPKLIKLNKSLKLDCTEYKNGAPVSIEDENGSRKPVEVLPEEIRISK